ncbi:DUF6194 family protein [Nocardia sp. NPDC059240]|uniref:DUF6194 family protein n=1 Tax=Nocardia sp. NPDC059240 TaxID=3346786 RepID=UPI0036D12278
MEIEEITEFIETLGGVLTLAPAPGSPFPEIAWGDRFFYYAPDAQIPTRTQPFATIITKNYPDDTTSDLDRPEAFRLNIHAGRDAFVERLGHTPRETPAHPTDAAHRDTLIAHPVYATAGWLAVVNPATSTEPAVRELLTAAHARARTNYLRNGS